MEDFFKILSDRYGKRLEWHARAGSTNDIARDHRFGDRDVVLAESQSEGRGQHGNRWYSQPGSNLTMSMVVVPSDLSAGDQFSLLESVSLGVADMLRDFGLDAQIKWPNDIYVAGRKIAGLLIENDICGAFISRAIIGIGLNVNQALFPADLPNPTSMSIQSGHPFDRTVVMDALYGNLSARLDRLNEGELQQIHRHYLSRLYLMGVEHDFADHRGNRFRGIIKDVAPTGELCVERLPGGTTHRYLFKEIEYGSVSKSV